MVTLIAICGAASLFALVTAFAGRKSNIHKHLQDLEGFAPRDGAERFSVLERVLDDAGRNKLERRLAEAGWYDITPLKMVIRSIVSGVVGAVIGVAVLYVTHHHETIFIVLAALLPIAGLAAPNFMLNSEIAQRKLLIQSEIPNFLDMVSTTVEAGIALNGALATSVDAVSGPLNEELKLALSDIRLGRSRSEALSAMAQRAQQIDLSTTVTAMIQSEKLGGNIAQVLEELSVEARERRMMRAEEIAAQLPVKMVFPMVLFMLPALFAMIFGAVAADFYSR